MPKFRKLPIVVDGILFTGTNQDAVADFCAPKVIQVVSNLSLIIPTLDGDMTVRPGDHVMRGAVGELYPVKPEAFKVTFEKVEEDSNHQGADPFGPFI